MEIDARGLSCPEPVILTKNAIAGNPSEITVMVDNNVAKENVQKCLEKSGYRVLSNEKGEDIIIHGRK